MLNSSFLHFLTLLLFKNRDRYINLTLISIILIFILSSVLFISSSIKNSLNKAIAYQPDLIVQKLLQGESSTTPISWQEKLLEIPGITKATPRVYGRYHFSNNKSALIIGIDFFEEQSNKAVEKLIENINIKEFLSQNNMIIGAGVANYFKNSFYNNSYNFLTPKGDLIKVKLHKSLSSNSALLSNDAIIVSSNLAKKILGLKENEVSDFALSVPNSNEYSTIKDKIEALYFDARVVTKEQIKRAYSSLFEYKSGLFLILFIITLLTFSLILYLRYSIVVSIEKREIGILRAVGWSIKDILKLKFLESITLVFISFIIGVVLAYIYIFIFDAPILKDIFLGTQNLKNFAKFTPVIDYGLLFTIFILYSTLFLASVLIPIWKIATTNPQEVMR